MPKIGKPKSKRVPVRLRHKIEKASAAKQRKQRKLAKKDPTWRSKIKKDPGIPNLFPYKARILEQIEEKKRLKDEEIQRKRAEAKAARTGVPADSEVLSDADAMSAASLVDDDDEDEATMEVDGDDSNPMAALLASAKARAAEYEEVHGEDDGRSDSDLSDASDSGALATSKSQTDPSSRAFTHLFPTVLSTADIILYVLDARDPPSTRSIPTERQIAAFEGGSKRLLLVLNKIDLVPPSVLKGWLAFLRRYHPALPLRASAPAANAKSFDHKTLTQKATSETLLRALKAYAASENFKRALTVGVVGFPNVGKSSVINTLVSCLGRRSGPAATGAEAGVTTSLKSIKLDSKLILLDSPGVVFPESAPGAAGTTTSTAAKGRSKKEDAHARLVLLNALPPKAISDPIPAVTLLLERLAADEAAMNGLLAHYGVAALMSGVAGDRTTDLLVQVARKRGRLSKGGVPNLEAAGMCVLADWRDGRIAGWVEPPRVELQTNGSSKAADGGAKKAVVNGDQKEIVGDWAEEFHIEGLWEPSKYKGVGKADGEEMEM